MASFVDKRLWEKGTAVVVSEDTNLYLLIKELVRSHGWRIDVASCDAQTAISHVNNRIADCVIAVDSPDMPVHETLRILFKDPHARLTPTLALLQPCNASDQILYERIMHVSATIKPLTPSTFSPAFRKMIKTWESPLMTTLRKVALLDGPERESQKIEILRKLCTDTTSMPYAVQALVSVLTARNHFREAEKVLIDTFKANPKSPALLANCAWFYISARMPQLAMRYFLKLKTIAPGTTMFNFDLASIHLACGDLAEATAALREWHHGHSDNTFMESYIARILVADGHLDSGETVGISKGIIRRTAEFWDQVEAPLRAVNNPATTPTQASGIKAS